MKTLSGCFILTIIFIAGIFAWLIFGYALGFALPVLASTGMPSWVISLFSIALTVWFFGLIVKASALASVPRGIKFVQSNFEEIIGCKPDELLHLPPVVNPYGQLNKALPIDVQRLMDWDAQLQSLGFRHVTDLTVLSTATNSGFARLYAHEQYKCRAEIHQIFSKATRASITNLTCAITTVMNETKTNKRWGLTTVNFNKYKGMGIEWALRHPRELWTSNAHWVPEQMMSYHLEQRERMMQTLDLSITTDLTWEGYCADSRREVEWKRKRVMSKWGVALFLENIFCKNKTEWWGDYRKFMNKAA